MKKLINQFVDITKDIKGKVICFGIDDKKILDIIESNKNILVCDILTNKSISIDSKKNKKEKNKEVRVNKIRNKYKKNKVDYVYMNIDDIIEYKDSIVKDTIYICSNKIYLYSEDKKEIEPLLRRYRRYKSKIKKIECLDNLIYEVDVKGIKMYKLKDKINGFIDDILDILDMADNIV